MKRICIYAFYDKDGIMDEYVFYYLSSMINYCSKIICVINGSLANIYVKRLEKIGICVYFRENIGFDAMAYKYGIEKINDLDNYDELIISNNSFFGPIYELDKMFNTMESRLSNSNVDTNMDENNDSIDFWGMSIHPQKQEVIHPTQEFKYINEHIQTFFVAFSKKLFLDNSFKKFWDNLNSPSSFLEAVCTFEFRLTSFFSKNGFKYDSYLDHDYFGDVNATILYPFDTVNKFKCPFVKRKIFTENYSNFIAVGEGTSARETLEFIKNTKYNVELIWDHILRTSKMSDIRMNLQLNYIVDSVLTDPKSVQITNSKRIALILYIFYEEAIDECLEYAQNMPENSDIYFVSPKDQVIELLRIKQQNNLFNLHKFPKIEFIKKINKGRDLSTYLIDCKSIFNQYDYICFFHDKRSPHLNNYLNVRSFFRHCMNSLLPTKNFVINLISKFEEEPKLGLLVPPPLHYGQFYASEYSLDPNNKKHMEKIMNELSLNVPFDDFPVAPYGDMFWVRGKAITNLYNKNWSYDDLPNEPIPADGTILHALERIIPLVVQSKNYYSAWCCSNDTARIEISNLYYRGKAINSYITQKLGKLSYDYIFNIIDTIHKIVLISIYAKLIKYTLINFLTFNLIRKFRERKEVLKNKISKISKS